MDTADAVATRRCARTYTLLLDGGVKVTWACGAHKVVHDEPAIDLEFLAEHLGDLAHHHRHHLHHRQPSSHHQGASA